MNEEKTLSSEYFYKGEIMNLRVDKVECPGGRISTREVCEHCDGVAILPVDADGTVILVRQFRYPFRKELLEAPAGKMDEGEEHLECGRRELSEEAGYSADEMIYLGAYYLSPGCYTERIHLYIAKGLHKGEAHPDEGEILNVEKYSFSDAVRMCDDGVIKDAKTVMLILRAARLLEI